jgi:hypothetical protein
MAFGIIEGIGLAVGAEAITLALPNPPLHRKLAKPSGPVVQGQPAPRCIGLGAGVVTMSTDDVYALVLKETGSQELQASTGKLGSRFREGLRASIDDEQVYLGLPSESQRVITPAGLSVVMNSGCIAEAHPPGATLHTVLSGTAPAVQGLTTIDARKVEEGDQSKTLSNVTLGAQAGQAIGTIVLGFKQGITEGVAQTFKAIAQFDPEPISKALLTIVGSIFDAIFQHHQQRVRIEHSVECAATPATNEALQSIEASVMSAHVLPEHGCQLLDHLYDSYKANLNQYGLIGRGSSSWACNSGCELLWNLTAVITKKKDRYLHLTDVACPPDYKTSVFAPRPTYVLASTVTSREQATDGHYGAGRRL